MCILLLVYSYSGVVFSIVIVLIYEIALWAFAPKSVSGDEMKHHPSKSVSVNSLGMRPILTVDTARPFLRERYFKVNPKMKIALC